MEERGWAMFVANFPFIDYSNLAIEKDICYSVEPLAGASETSQRLLAEGLILDLKTNSIEELMWESQERSLASLAWLESQ